MSLSFPAFFGLPGYEDGVTLLDVTSDLNVSTVGETGGTTYYVLDKMKTLEKYLRNLGSNMDFKKVERQLVKVTFGD